jgi:hypothetical protein
MIHGWGERGQAGGQLANRIGAACEGQRPGLSGPDDIDGSGALLAQEAPQRGACRPLARRARRGFAYGVPVLAIVVWTAGAAAQSVHDITPTDSFSLSPATAPPVTVADLIGMTTVGGQAEEYCNFECTVVSPDGEMVAVLVRRGNLVRNTIDYSLLTFRTADLLRASRPDTVATRSSSSNRPAFARLRWLADNATLAFLGEDELKQQQVYTVDTRTHAVTQRTHATAEILSSFAGATGYDITTIGGPVFYIANPSDTGQYADLRAHGFVLSPHARVDAAITGNWRGVVPSLRKVIELRVVRHGTDTSLTLPDSAEGYKDCDKWQDVGGGLNVNPQGTLATLACVPLAAPLWWLRYRDRWTRVQREKFQQELPELVLLDLTTGQARPLIGTPAFLYTHTLWAPDGHTVFVGNTLLPLTGPDSAARAVHQMAAEVDVRSGAITVIAARDSLIPQRWNPQTHILEFAIGSVWPGVDLPLEQRGFLLYRKTAHAWTQLSTAEAAATVGPRLRVDEGLNAPPRLVAVDPMTHRTRVAYDPNPGLLVAHRFAREEVFRWTSRDGGQRSAGLYWPPDFVPGRRYPLVIQSHGFDSTYFWPSGASTSGYAAQPLANAGMFVVQLMTGYPDSVTLTSREGPTILAELEGAIDALDQHVPIDRSKVGLQGWSITCRWVLYFLTHSTYSIAAATVTDGTDMSYVQAVLFGPAIPYWLSGKGGLPWGPARLAWLREAPGFNLDRVHTPLRLTAIQPNSLLMEWEPWAGLLLQGKPAELVYFPDADHEMTRPWERLASQQGAVDWYRFWLQGYEDPDPAKTEQYARWSELRKLQQRQALTDTTAIQH